MYNFGKNKNPDYITMEGTRIELELKVKASIASWKGELLDDCD
jgi:hypothetical protein